MSFYTCFDWFNKLKLFVNERNLKIDVVLNASRAVVIRAQLFKTMDKFIHWINVIVQKLSTGQI